MNNLINKLLKGMRTIESTKPSIVFEADGREITQSHTLAVRKEPEVEKLFKPITSGFDKLVFPIVNPDDQEQVASLIKYTTTMAKSFKHYRHVSVCPIRDLVQELDIQTNPESEKYMRIIQRLHCVDFSELTPQLLEMLPHMYNFIASSGQVTHPCLEAPMNIETLPVKAR